MWSARAVDLLVWVPAGNRSAIVAGYARAAADLDLLAERASRRPAPADSAAQRFLDWLRTTERRWAVVLDGVTSPVDLDGLWPQGPAGQVVVTSRLRESELGRPGDRRDRPRRRRVQQAGGARLPQRPAHQLPRPADRGARPGRGPRRAADRARPGGRGDHRDRQHLPGVPGRVRAAAAAPPPTRVIDGCPPSLLATWSLAVEHAHELPPAGLSWPALVFASILDTNGIPAAVLTSPAACAYITGRTAPTAPSSTGRKHEPARRAPTEPGAVRLRAPGAARPGQRGHASAARTVWLHPAVRAAVRAYLAPGNVEQVVAAAADGAARGLAEPGAPGRSPQLSQALRDCAAALRAFAGDLLWKPEAHPVLLRAGASLHGGPRARGRRHRYWQALGAASSQLLGLRARAVGARQGPAGRRLREQRARSPRRCPSSRRRSPTARRPSARSTRRR